MKYIINVLTFTLLLILTSSCAENKKQRDTRNLSWYQINMDARGKTVRIGLFKAYQPLMAFLEDLGKDELLTNLKIKTEISVIEQDDSTGTMDIFIGDIAHMMELKSANQLLTPVFSKINTCDLVMKEKPTYREWMNVTDNFFVPWLSTLPEIESKVWESQARFRKLNNAFQLAQNSILINQHPDAEPEKSIHFLEQLQAISLTNNQFGKALFYLPIFVGVNRDSKAKAASLVAIDAMIKMAAQRDQLLGVAEDPELKASIHPQWMIRILELAERKTE
ncbi:MAG: hypothetical protein ACK4GL_07450 [Flavobacteriales bacterium]